MTDRLSAADRDKMLIETHERVADIPKIKDQVTKINGGLTEARVKLAKTDEIAKSAKEKADSNRTYIDRLVIGMIGASLAALGALVVALFQMAVR